MNDLAIEIKNLGLGIRVGDHDPFHTSIMHKIKTKQVTGLVVAVEKSSLITYFNKMLWTQYFQVISDLVHHLHGIWMH